MYDRNLKIYMVVISFPEVLFAQRLALRKSLFRTSCPSFAHDLLFDNITLCEQRKSCPRISIPVWHPYPFRKDMSYNSFSILHSQILHLNSPPPHLLINNLLNNLLIYSSGRSFCSLRNLWIIFIPFCCCFFFFRLTHFKIQFYIFYYVSPCAHTSCQNEHYYEVPTLTDSSRV